MTVLEQYKLDFKKILPTLKGGVRVGRAREASMKSFAYLGGIPHRKDEGWRYFDLGPIRKFPLKCAKRPPAQTVPKFTPLTNWPLIVVLDGSILGSTPDARGVKIMPAAAALERVPSWAGDYHSPGLEENPLERLNMALFEGGLFIYVTEKAQIPGLEIIFLEGGQKNCARHLRNSITIDRGVKTRILMRTISLEKNPGWTNMVSSINLGKGAHLSLICDFEQKQNSFVTARNQVTVNEQATFRQISLAAGLTSHRLENEIILAGEKAQADLFSGALAGENEVVDVVSRIHHRQPNATSSQSIRTVAGRKGQTAFQGSIVVEQGAQKTNARQKCHSLILDPSGEANVKPELLIFADDVACSHGATVGEIDEGALFYMMQRGIPEAEAKAVLVRAFLGDILEPLGEDVLKAHFEDKVAAWMQSHARGGPV